MSKNLNSLIQAQSAWWEADRRCRQKAFSVHEICLMSICLMCHTPLPIPSFLCLHFVHLQFNIVF